MCSHDNTPTRTGGNTRRSSDDVTQIAEVAELAEEGITAAGIRHILSLRAEWEALRQQRAEPRQA